MKQEKIIKICEGIFTREIMKAKVNYQNFDFKKYERELYWESIKSFKKGFIKKLRVILLTTKEGDD